MHYLATTKPNAEFYAEKALAARGCDPYLPKVMKRVAHAGRVIDAPRPFLPRYIFIDEDSVDSCRVIRTCPGIAGLVSFGEAREPSLVHTMFIDRIRGRETNGFVDLDERYIAPDDYEIGEVVRVKDGPFASFNAIFEEKNGDRRALVAVDIFGRAVRVQLELSQIEKL